MEQDRVKRAVERELTGAERVVARFDTYSVEEHQVALREARARVARKRARADSAALAAARLRAPGGGVNGV